MTTLTPPTPPTVFMFSGQGSQYYQMGRELYASEPIFRAAMLRLDAGVSAALGTSVVDAIYDERRAKVERFEKITLSHTAIVMVELALAETLGHYGIEPDYVLGASLGEFAAAAVAEVFTPETCLRVLARHATALNEPTRGGMLAILGDVELHQQIHVLAEHTEIAARNYPGNFVVSGADDALRAAEEVLRARDVPCQRVPVAHAFHSRHLDGYRQLFMAAFHDVPLKQPRIPVVSCAEAGEPSEVSAGHLWRSTRNPVEFGRTIAMLEARGPHRYLDLGPSGTLHNFIRYLVPTTSKSESRPLLSPYGRDLRLLSEVCAAHRRRRHGRPPTTALQVYGFPGQGSQTKGMGEGLFDEFPEHTAIADTVLGYSIRQLCHDNPDRRLGSTRYAQPALYVTSALAYERQTKKLASAADFLVGHSVGEYVALYAAGVFDFETGLRLVQRRGELMSHAEGTGAMAAVLGCDRATVEEILAEPDLAALDIANVNGPDQLVLAGPHDSIDIACPRFESLGGVRFVRLNVQTPFHSRYMRSVGREFASYLDRVTLRSPQIPVIANVDAKPYRPDAVRTTLAGQLVSPVQWFDSIRLLAAQGEFEFTELGPGRVLTNLVKKIMAAPLTKARV